jgi:hypothetical protein
MMGPFFECCTAEGRRERGARMELALRSRVDRDRGRDEGYVELEEDREGADMAAAAAVAAVAITSSGLTAS